MFAKLASFATIALLAVATPAMAQCDTGSLECCTQVQSSGSSPIADLLTLLGIVVEGVDVPVGVGCSPISVIGVGSAGCSASPVCCEDTSHGAVAIGCVPVGVSL
ncbi:hypothetical protein ACEPAH_9443 [Sanghuangporus vaninii]